MYSSVGSFDPRYQHQQQYPSGMYPAAPSPYGARPDLSTWFQSVDKDRSGKITAEELRQALVNGNMSHFSTEACKLLITMFDKDKTGTIDFEEFQQLFNYINQWKATFEMYDKDKSSSIEEKELEQAFTQMGYRFSKETIKTIVSKFDTPTKKKQITFDNFIVACVQIHNLTNAFRARDKEGKGVATLGYEDYLQAVLQSM